MGVKTQFSIKDLENLSGIKAHTIRIWEKRYRLLTPERTDTNIRNYNIENLTKLLNVTYLYNHGYKISKIAKLKNDEVVNLIHQSGLTDSTEAFAISELKSAMLTFNPQLFQQTFSNLEEKYTFRKLFFNILIPLLNDIGLLWQTGTIDPSHERFISELIKQKITVEIEKQFRKTPSKTDRLFVLFLPMDEIHEIGLLYVNYELLNLGYKTIYLGNNIPTDNLKHFNNHHDSIVFVSYLTVQPDKDSLEDFISELKTIVLKQGNNNVWLFGSQIIDEPDERFPESFKVFRSLSDFLKAIQN
jgi:MerR family transcriptional regulator, light-induced transcriptional regulator